MAEGKESFGFILFRLTINFILVALCIPIEMIQTVVQATSDDYSKADDLTANFWLNAFHGVFIYTLYY
jgi:hypothetical protein